jgi:hypothetical protein
MLNKTNTKQGERTMHVKPYRRIVINSSLNLYKDQERLLTYEGNLIRVVTAGRHKAGIVILNNDGTQSEEKTVDAMHLCNNLKIVNPTGDPDFKGLNPVYMGKGKVKTLDELREENLQKLFNAIKEKEVA